MTERERDLKNRKLTDCLKKTACRKIIKLQ